MSTTIDRSLKEAFKGEKLDSEFGDVKKELGAHKDELTGSLDGLHEHAKANKLLNHGMRFKYEMIQKLIKT